jgi:protein-tyrosine phosphatase
MLGEVTTILAAPTNLRDLRGLRTADGRLYRSEAPHPDWADNADVPVWPPATVVDLRSPEECAAPHPFAEVAAVHPVPLGASLAPALAARRLADLDLASVYRHLVTDAADGPFPVLVHCTAGKDRTGIVIAVLLRAAGVRRDDVVADYLRTSANLPRLWSALRAAGVHLPRRGALLEVHADALHGVLDEIEATPGGVAGWLDAHGVVRPRSTGSPPGCSALPTCPEQGTLAGWVSSIRPIRGRRADRRT